MARVLHLFLAPKRHAPMEERSSVEVVQDAGFEGCAHARPGGKRQVLLVDDACRIPTRTRYDQGKYRHHGPPT